MYLYICIYTYMFVCKHHHNMIGGRLPLWRCLLQKTPPERKLVSLSHTNALRIRMVREWHLYMHMRA